MNTCYFVFETGSSGVPVVDDRTGHKNSEKLWDWDWDCYIIEKKVSLPRVCGEYWDGNGPRKAV